MHSLFVFLKGVVLSSQRLCFTCFKAAELCRASQSLADSDQSEGDETTGLEKQLGVCVFVCVCVCFFVESVCE